MKKQSCLICNKEIESEFDIEGVIDIRSYKNREGKKMFNVVVNMKDDFCEGYVGESLTEILKEISNNLFDFSIQDKYKKVKK